MISIVMNWRRNVMLSLFLLLLASNFYSQTCDLSAGWWIEQQRYSGLSYEITRRKRCLPLWYIRFQIIIERFNDILNNGIKINLMCCLLKFVCLIWLFILQKVIITMVNKGLNPSEFFWNWSKNVEQTNVEINLQIVINQINPTIELASSALQDDMRAIEAEFENIDYDTCIHTNTKAQLDEQQNILTEEPADNSPKTKCNYSPKTEREMKKFYNTLSEKDKRRYAGIEAMKLEHGGNAYIAEVFGCCQKTVRKGIKEIFEMPVDVGYEERIRKPGGGRKPYWITHGESLDRKFLDVVKSNTAGDPMREDVLWTNLSHAKISELLAKHHQVVISTKVVRQLLGGHKFHRRKAHKGKIRKIVENRDAQFKNISGHIHEYTSTLDPVISMDTKKKEFLGLFRNGPLYTQKTIVVPDHDFPSYSKGVIIPHSLWDVNKNKGYITIGNSKDTSEFACDSIRNWWNNYGKNEYPHSRRMTILCDGGGSNSSRSYLFKQDIQKLVDEIGIEIRIAHYPPYTSKYNLIEHRMFPFVTKACSGVIFENYEQVKTYMEKTKTTTGLTVNAEILKKEYKTKKKVDKDFKKNMKIVFDDYLPKWNYRAIPKVNKTANVIVL